MDNLRFCYEQMRRVLGDDMEPFESVRLVERYRQFWKPLKVKIFLLAESHVFTTDQDRAIDIPLIPGLPDYPRDYAKFVYCLGYGESALTKCLAHPLQDGTPQFWKIFFSCMRLVNSNADFASILKSGTKLDERVANKIRLLKTLQNNGVWLVDASISALYDGGKKPNGSVMSKAIRTSWLNYTKNIVEQAHPKHVIVIGKGVARDVEADLRKMTSGSYTVIAQPNAHLSSEEHLNNFRAYYSLCNA